MRWMLCLRPSSAMPDSRDATGAFRYSLARFGGARPPAPAWYEALRAERPHELRIKVEGAEIEVLVWGEVGLPGILLVHGYGAHARWWGPVAPLLAGDYRVASLSLSGSGGSHWRERYSSRQFAEEMFGAIDAAGLAHAGRPVIAAHSFSGRLAATAMRRRGAELTGIVFVDSFVVPPTMRPSDRSPEPKVRDFPDAASALGRFRLWPDQSTSADYILDDVARAGLKEEEGRWRWRFDPNLMIRLECEEYWGAITDPTCPIAFVHGETSSLMTPQIVAAQRAGVPPGTPIFGIPEAGHHIMFDQPFALVAALRALAACWFAE